MDIESEDIAELRRIILEQRRALSEERRARSEERRARSEERRALLADTNAVVEGLRRENLELSRAQLDMPLDDYLLHIHRVSFQMCRLLPIPQSSAVPTTLSEGQKAKPATSGTTSIVGKYYPRRLRIWADFERLYRAAFDRLHAALGNQALFPSIADVNLLEKGLREDLPLEFLGSDAFVNEGKTSHFVHETLEKPAQRILNAYLNTTDTNKTLYFDSRTAGCRVENSVVIDDTAAEGEGAPVTFVAVTRPPPKTRPDCLVLCADTNIGDETMLSLVSAEPESIEPVPVADVESGQALVDNSFQNVRNVHRITLAEHKMVTRLRATTVSSYANGQMDEDFVVQLARAARTRSTAEAQEDAAREFSRGKPGQDPSTLLYHTALFPEYTRRQIDPAGRVIASTPDATLSVTTPVHERADLRVLALSMLSAVALMAFESRPEPARLRSINISQLPMFPDEAAPESSIPSLSSRATSRQPSTRRSSEGPDHRKRGNEDSRDDDHYGNDGDRTRGRLAVPAYRPRQSSPLKRQRSESGHAERGAEAWKELGKFEKLEGISEWEDRKRPEQADDDNEEQFRGRKRRCVVGLQYISKRSGLPLGPTLPSTLDPSTFRPIRPYCTQACLRSLVQGGDLDYDCPNAVIHAHALRRDGVDLRQRPRRHALTGEELCDLVRLQVLSNSEQDCACLIDDGFSGAIGSLFKITVTGYGYTFVGKGVQKFHSRRLGREVDIYDGLAAQQGVCIPVCLGLVQLLLPYPMANCTLVTHLLLMSYAGPPLYRVIRVHGVDVERETERTMAELESLGLVDNDDESNGNLTCLSNPKSRTLATAAI
ncbi:hypothetical protein CMQ_5156 [Grosmannia clavigera kw1407]|uniref:Uncharacterized protein n=1 Tax=Grosmannia clavigera (strain kw1407 / UAMH 11150) TaxID=655863 RepID=F0XBS6_GROCL|nr:uncharacterized protein CMQ_5156 [Grosmannia clavigera kw1407]EFX04894.1 hypothetical protein CMQ_5156 [Grosmannia clavigera kw1407]